MRRNRQGKEFVVQLLNSVSDGIILHYKLIVIILYRIPYYNCIMYASIYVCIEAAHEECLLVEVV